MYPFLCGVTVVGAECGFKRSASALWLESHLTPATPPLSLVRRGELGASTPPREWGLGAGGEVFYAWW